MELNKPNKGSARSRKPSFDIPKRSRGNRLNIADQEWLKFEVRNRELVIQKVEDGENDLKISDMEESNFAST